MTHLRERLVSAGSERISYKSWTRPEGRGTEEQHSIKDVPTVTQDVQGMLNPVEPPITLLQRIHCLAHLLLQHSVGGEAGVVVCPLAFGILAVSDPGQQDVVVLWGGDGANFGKDEQRGHVDANRSMRGLTTIR